MSTVEVETTYVSSTDAHPKPQLVEGAGPTTTDLADLLLHNHGHSLRYVSDAGVWLTWSDGWSIDPECKQMYRLTLEMIRQLQMPNHELEQLMASGGQTPAASRVRAARRSLNRYKSPYAITNIIKAAALQTQQVVTSDQLDREPHLLRVANGTIDLRTGRLASNDPSQLLTVSSPIAYDPHAQAPRWNEFLKEVFVDDEVVAYVQRVAGYCMSADTRAHQMWLLTGGGANGKSTFVKAFTRVLGPLAQTTPETVLMASSSTQSNDIARLGPTRFAVLPETDKGQSLNETRVKALVSGDTISARMLYQEYRDITPIAKFVLLTNHLPRIKGNDDGIWRRLVTIPFTQQFEVGAEADLPEKLASEAEGILSWAVQGAIEYFKTPGRLPTPQAIEQSRNKYRRGQDVTGRFLEECFEVKPGAFVEADQMSRQYAAWCLDNDENPLSKNELGAQLRLRGLERLRKGQDRRWAWAGVTLRQPHGNP